ncbi:UvrD-helicase domain-containing protein [Cytobacillus oceanisediminis]|uniref:DNA 3'-5' helicase n=1 Tax=Niallia alba TaxID=2729105 RepID=A0A7Y0K8Q7_9BACI|nr:MULTISPECIES: RNA polymerase recycling motor HelD [Bacillaceae]MBZ9534027.1 UvrD-helicase domain-containing protein [Cytobacillus oceanisediminis]NMO77707.1 UvrD-helicase domain-containing protein [Niallia alba]
MTNNREALEKVTEQKRIDFVRNEMDDKLKLMEQDIHNIGGDVSQIRSNFWEDVTVNLDEPDDVIETFTSIKQQAELLGERERTYGQIHRQQKILHKLKDTPYFGRIDFDEAGEGTEQVYIGIASFMDKKNETFYIYDWRAPISSVYYDYSPGPASYQTPSGKIDGELLLKRQFIIRNGKLISLFDTGVTIGDELLLEVLGNNANSMMKSIVATIQKEQNQIIRNEKSRYLLVQGVAGSGKTSAALQRVAYLLYKHRDTLKSDNIMLFSPNPLFNSYVSTVLPELGEENMRQSTFFEYLQTRIGKAHQVEDSFSQLEYLLTETNTLQKESRLKSIQFKSSVAFKDLIDNYFRALHKDGMAFKDIVFRNKVFISREELTRKFYEMESHISIPNRIQLLIEWAQKEMKKHAKAERKQQWVDDEIELLDKEEYLEAFHAAQKKNGKEDEFDYFDQEERFLRKVIVNRHFKSIYVSIKKRRFIDIPAMYREIFQLSCPESLTEEVWRKIAEQTIANLEQSFLSYEDGTPFAYLKDKIEGRKSTSGIRQVFIDEAQDYSDFQMNYLKELFPYSKMTLLGDINQAIYAHQHNEIVSKEDNEEVERIVLMKSYRSTKEIVEFTRGLAVNGDLIEPFNRHGEKPKVIHAQDSTKKIDDLLIRIKDWQENGYKTIAIICKTIKESSEVYELLKKKIDVRFIQKGTTSYEKGISVIPAYLAKGIEFDGVVLYNASSYHGDLEKELFYTACTRAMHALTMYMDDGKLNPYFDQINQDTYETIEVN